MSFKLTVGKIGVLAIDAVHNEAIVSIFPISGVVDRDYLSYWLQHADLAADVDTYVKGATLNRRKIESIAVPLPTLEAQNRIARYLSIAQMAASRAANVHRASQDLRASAGAQLFRRRTWPVRALGELASIGSGGTPSRTNEAYWNGSIPWVKTAEVDYRWVFDTSEQITDLGLAESSAKLYPPETILVAMYGDGATRGRVGRLGVSASLNQACAAINPTDEVDGDYLYHYLAGSYEDLRALGHGAQQKNLSATLLASFPIALPALPEQRQLASAMDVMDAKVHADERHLTALCGLFEAMLEHVFGEAA